MTWCLIPAENGAITLALFFSVSSLIRNLPHHSDIFLASWVRLWKLSLQPQNPWKFRHVEILHGNFRKKLIRFPPKVGGDVFLRKKHHGKIFARSFCVGDPKHHFYGGCVFFEVKVVRNSDPIKRQTGSDWFIKVTNVRENMEFTTDQRADVKQWSESNQFV